MVRDRQGNYICRVLYSPIWKQSLVMMSNSRKVHVAKVVRRYFRCLEAIIDYDPVFYVDIDSNSIAEKDGGILRARFH